MGKSSDNLSEKWLGQRFGKLTVIGYGHDDRHNQYLWKCRCDCGKELYVHPANAKMGRVHSCGCLQREKATTHGQRYTQLYRTWVDMRRRCRDSKHPTYANYGGRGIKVCDEWQSFEVFEQWALSHGYTDTLTIDRIDVNGNYEPSNCRWATIQEQSNNKRNNRYVDVFGEHLTITEATRKYGNGLKVDTVIHRIDKYGYTPEKALTDPIHRFR